MAVAPRYIALRSLFTKQMLTPSSVPMQIAPTRNILCAVSNRVCAYRWGEEGPGVDFAPAHTLVDKKIGPKIFSPKFLDPENLGLMPFSRAVLGISPKLSRRGEGGPPPLTDCVI